MSTLIEQEDELVRLLKIKADTFYRGGMGVHIKYKRDLFKNGFIHELSSDFFILDDFKEGKFPIFFLELRDITPYREKPEVKDGTTK